MKYCYISNQVHAKTQSRSDMSLSSNLPNGSKKFWNWVNSSESRCDPITAFTDNNATITEDFPKLNKLFNKQCMFTKANMTSFSRLRQSRLEPIAINYALKAAYAFEQCSTIQPIMLETDCFIRVYWDFRLSY